MAQWTLGMTREAWQAAERKEADRRLRGVSDRKLRMWIEGARRTVAAFENHPPLPGTRDYVAEQHRESLAAARSRLALFEAESARRATALNIA